MTGYSDDLDKLGEKHLAAVGAVAAVWAHIEWQMDTLIWELADVKQQLGACITSQIGSVHPRGKAIIALLKLRGGSQARIDDLTKFVADSAPLVVKRNRIVHDPWLTEIATGTPTRFKMTAEKTLEYDFKPNPTDSVLKAQYELALHLERFKQLADDIRAEMPAWKQISELLPRKITSWPEAPPGRASEAE